MYRLDEIFKIYQEKLITADEAAAMVEPNNRIHFGLGLGVVKDLDAALARRADTLRGVEVVSTVGIQQDFLHLYKAGQSLDNVRFASAHYNGFDRKMAVNDKCWYIPMNFNELPSYWDQNDCQVDIAMLQVGPMDKYGNFNLGPQVSDIWGVLKSAKKVIVEVNTKMPRTHGVENTINLADIDFVVEGSNTEMAQIPPGKASEIDKKIASFVVEKIRDNSTLQLGIGALPSTIGTLLAESDVKDISGHTEMLVDGYLELYKAGKLTNKKAVNPGKLVYAFAGGSQDLYDFIDDNPICHVAPVDYVNNQGVIASMDNFVSVNSCIKVDLFGQVCSETSNHMHISGTGGQLDFVQGAYHSKGGQSFICTPSTRKFPDGKVRSLILPSMIAGYVVTTPRTCTHWVVTEFGAVNLKGKSTWQRAEALISIAHPDFQEYLIGMAEKIGIWRTTSKCTL
ncbi:MAG: acetyl-CoA hydrolase/transferase C-terminal domain-containing protein [Peptostreptococcaceae bacterium]|nr:acetyl-CoA hydrolase/transferase C-terminal domain-containing protein [Peptostreptococcaceae bacterium]MDY5739318.1 acetyl-CoA hydrolase/transferase C-terminal domain-containing protein [Anaerovoracaceae bacterium]